MNPAQMDYLGNNKIEISEGAKIFSEFKKFI
jgi:hypothetical protein